MAPAEMQKENLDKALELLNTAQIYVVRSKGNQFFSYVQYYLTRAELHRKQGHEQKALQEFYVANMYAERNNAQEKLEVIQAAKEQKEWMPKVYELRLESVTSKEIGEATEQAGINKDYHEIKKQMDFLSVWQKIVDINGKEEDELITSAILRSLHEVLVT